MIQERTCTQRMKGWELLILPITTIENRSSFSEICAIRAYLHVMPLSFIQKMGWMVIYWNLCALNSTNIYINTCCVQVCACVDMCVCMHAHERGEGKRGRNTEGWQERKPVVGMCPTPWKLILRTEMESRTTHRWLITQGIIFQHAFNFCLLSSCYHVDAPHMTGECDRRWGTLPWMQQGINVNRSPEE